MWDRNVELLLRAQDLELVLGVSAASMYEVLELIGAGRGWTIASTLSDFHPWEGVAFLPLFGVERFRVAAVWADELHMSARANGLIEALRAVAEKPSDHDA